MTQPFGDLPAPASGYQPIGAAERIIAIPNGVRAVGAAGTIEVVALAPGTFRVGLFPPGLPCEYPSFAVAAAALDGDATVRDLGDAWSIATPAATARIDLNPIRVRFTDSAGRSFAEDDPNHGMGFVLTPKAPGILPDPLGPPGWMHIGRPPGERYFGCGERTSGLEKTRSHQVFWNIDPPAGHTASLNNLYTSIPFLLALRDGAAWGLFLDSTHRVEFNLAQQDEDRLWFGVEGGPLVYYAFAGPAPRDVLRRYTALTGRTPMPPIWSLGNQQSSWNYESAAQVAAIAREFRQREIPCDALYLDIDYMEGYRVFTWSGERFPDPSGFVREMNAQGFQVVTIVDPGVKVDERFPVYTDGRDAGLFCRTADGEEYRNAVWPGLCAFPDFTSGRTRDWWGDQHAALLDAGVAGVWCDMNEPALFIPNQSTMPGTVVHRGDDRPAIHAQVHNAYGLLMARATRDGLQRLRPQRRPFVISRSGYAGLQRYAMQWTGDNSSWWEHLWMSMPQLQNMGLSGIAWAGVDVGGFWGDSDGELLTRWTEFGIFQPFCRNHTAKGTRAQEPWAFGEPYESQIRALLLLRQRLIPYLYTLFEECHRTGAPILRPLLFEYPADEAAYTADDQFLLGEALLIAPITRPGVEHRHVYLPEGTWFQYWTGERYHGPAHVLAHAPLGRPAIYVRANTAVPLWPAMCFTGEGPADPLTLLLYPAEGTGEATLYEDSGDGYEHEHGAFARRSIRCETTAAGVVVHLSEQAGDWQPPRGQIDVDVRGLAARPVVRVDGTATDAGRWDGDRIVVPIPASSAACSVEVRAADA